MSKRTRVVVCLLALVLIALCLIFPAVFETAVHAVNRVLNKAGSALLSVIPLFLYSILGLTIRKYLWQRPRDAAVTALDRQEASSLTLTGFCFTSLSFLLAFFKDEIKRGEPGPETILFFFAVALGCFIASYMALRYRTKNLFMVLNEALLDDGLWCVLF